MRQAQINVRTRACSRTSIARTKQAALTHNVRGKELTQWSGIRISTDQRNEGVWTNVTTSGIVFNFQKVALRNINLPLSVNVKRNLKI